MEEGLDMDMDMDMPGIQARYASYSYIYKIPCWVTHTL